MKSPPQGGFLYLVRKESDQMTRVAIAKPTCPIFRFHLDRFSNLSLGQAYECKTDNAIICQPTLFGPELLYLHQIVADTLEFLNIPADFFSTEQKGMAAWAVHTFILTHDEQRRKSGDWYGDHVVDVAKLLYRFGFDPEAVIAGLLHDGPEDHPEDLMIPTVYHHFGQRVGFLVEAMTKNKDMSLDVYHNQLVLMGQKDPAVFFLKLFDNRSNLRTVRLVDDTAWQIKWLEKLLGPTENMYSQARAIIAVDRPNLLPLFDQIHEENTMEALGLYQSLRTPRFCFAH